MEELIQELAKTLHIGNEAMQSLITNYPQLRQQLTAYYITDMFGTFSGCTASAIFIIWAASFLFDYDSQPSKVAFWRKTMFITFLIFVILSLISYTLKYILAPDLIFMQTILGNLK